MTSIIPSITAHIRDCHCSASGLSFALLTEIYGSCANVTFESFDFLHFLTSDNDIAIRRSAARFAYLLSTRGGAELGDIADAAIANADDPWVVAFLLGSIARSAAPRPERIIPLLVKQFNRESGCTVASRFFAAVILEPIAREDAGADIVAAQDLGALIKWISCCSQLDDDQAPETQFVLLLSSVLRSVWRRALVARPEGAVVLFGHTLLAMFDIFAREGDADSKSGLVTVQVMFVEILRCIASFEDFAESVRSQQILKILGTFAQTEGELATQAAQTLEILSQ
jgi:hypothetical protein